MIQSADLDYIKNGPLEKQAAKGWQVGAGAGALGGLILQLLRPKDKDDKGLASYLLSILTGAGLGAAGGFAYDTLTSKPFKPAPSQPNKTVPAPGNTIPVPQELKDKVVTDDQGNVSFGDNFKYTSAKASDEDAAFYRAMIAYMKEKGEHVDNYRDLYKDPTQLTAENHPVTDRFFLLTTDRANQIRNPKSSFDAAYSKKLMQAGEQNMAVMPNKNGDIVVGWVDPVTYDIAPATRLPDNGVIYKADPSTLDLAKSQLKDWID